MSNSGKLVIISAPSGTGKSTVIREILRLHPEFMFSVSATTRAKRPHEQDGREYFFVSREKFEEMIADDEFFEWAQYVGNYYGTPKKPIEEHLANGKTVLLDIEVQGAKQVMQKAPYAVSVFITAPDMAELERRLRGRGTDSEEKLAARLERAKLEMEEQSNYNHIVINDDAKRAAKEIIEIIGRK